MLICREDREIEAGAESLLLARSIPPCALLLSSPPLHPLPAILAPLSLRDTKRPIVFSTSIVPNYERRKP